MTDFMFSLSRAVSSPTSSGSPDNGATHGMNHDDVGNSAACHDASNHNHGDAASVEYSI